MRAAHARERGSVLLAALILGLAAAAATAALAEAAYQLAEEVRVRREVLCARYAALSGLALGPSSGDRAGDVGATVSSLTVTVVAKAPGWCVIRSIGVCGSAQRTVERTVAAETCS